MGIVRKVIISDTQLHEWKRFGCSSDNPLLSKLTYAQKNALEQFIDICVKVKADSVEHAGDVFQARGLLPVVAFNLADKFFNKILKDQHGIPLFVTGGNHDELDDENYSEYGDALNFLRHDTGYQDPFKVFRINYWDDIDYSLIKGYDLVVAHKEPVGAKDGKYECKIGIDWKTLAANNRSVWFGHIHTRQLLSPNCFVAGDFIQLSFGETADKGIWLVEKFDGNDKTGKVFFQDSKLTATESYFVDDNFKVSFFPLQFPQFITVDNSQQLPEKEERKDNFFKIENADSKIDDTNVVCATTPKVYADKIQSDELIDVLKEWLTIEDKPIEYLEVVKTFIEQNSHDFVNLYKGRITDVEMSDFMSYGKSHFQFTDGLICLHGKNGTFGDSNGVGKSTLLEAVFWCLFNDLTKEQTTKEEVIRDFPTLQKEAVVTVKMMDTDGKVIIITRSTKTGLAVFMDQDGIEVDVVGHMKAKERQDFLETQILGFDKTFFLTSSYFSQDNLKMITGLKKTEKTSMIMSLLGFDQYEALYNKVTAKIKQLEALRDGYSNELNKCELGIGFIESRLSSIGTDLVNSQSELARVNSQDFDAPRELRLEVESKIEQLSTVMPTLVLKDQIVMQHSQFVSSVDYNKVLLGYDELLLSLQTRMRAIESEYADKIKQVSAERNSKILELKVSKQSLDKESIDIKSKIDSLNRQQKGVFCSACGSEVTEQSSAKCIEQMQTRLLEVSQSIKELIVSIDSEELQLADAVKVIQEELNSRKDKGNEKINGVTAEIAETKLRQAQEYSVWQQKQNELSQEVLSKNNLIKQENELLRKAYNDKCSSINAELTIYKNNVNEYLKVERELEYSLKTAQNKVDECLKIIEQEKKKLIEPNEKKNSILKCIKETEDSILIYDFWKQAFSSKGIRASLLVKFCNSFNKILSGYVADVANGVFNVYAEPQKELASGEIRNELELYIELRDSSSTEDGGRRRRYAMYSGGEKRRVDIALCLSLNKWVSERHHLPNGVLGLMLLDELFSYIDKTGEETTAMVLQREGINKSVIIVSHTPELKSYATKTVRVYKDAEGISRFVDDED